jgi:hypothetical protein
MKIAIAPRPLTPPWFLRSSMTLATRTNVGSAHHKDVKSVMHTTKTHYEIKKIYEGIEFHTSSPLHQYYFSILKITMILHGLVSSK